MKPGSFSVPLTVLLTSVFLHIFVAGILALLFALFFLLITIGEIVVFLFEVLLLFAILQLANTFIGSGAFGLMTPHVMRRIESLWVYPIVLGLSVLIHFVVFGITFGAFWMFVPYEKIQWIGQYGWKITAAASTIIAVVAIITYKLSARAFSYPIAPRR